MPHITLTPFASSYRYENATLIQQNNSGALVLSHRVYGSSVSQYDLAFTLMPPPIDVSCCELDSVILELPIRRFRFHHYPLFNRVIVSSSSTFSTARSGIEITPSSFSNGFLSLDITTLLRNWNPNQIPLYKMMVTLEAPDLSIQIRNQSAVFPRVQIAYHTLSYDKFAFQTTGDPSVAAPPSATEETQYPTSDQADSYELPSYNNNSYPNNIYHPIINYYPVNTAPSANDKHSYIEVCSVDGSNCFIDANGRFLFHSIDSASDIGYSADTGLFSFSSTGIYYAGWMLYLRGTGSITWITIGLQNQTTGEVFPFNSPCVIPGQICGQHILHVEDISQQYALINSSESTIQLCSNNSNASLVIFKL